jgi:hypothetical protein
MRIVSKAALAVSAVLASAAVGLAATGSVKSTDPRPADVPPPKHWDVLGKYCTECHNATDWAGGIAFDVLSPEDIASDSESWEKAIRKMRTGMMPPAGKPRPQRAVLDAFAGELATRLDSAGHVHPVPGTKSLHRLNRTEYANAVRDVLDLQIDVSTLLPADDSAEGFDNIADVLGVSPTLIQSYVSAALKISRWAVGDRSMQPTMVRYVAPSGLSQREHIEGMPLGTRGGMRFTHNFPLDAEYEFRIAAGTGFRFAGPVTPDPLLDVTINGQQVQAPDMRRFRVRVPAGPQSIAIALVEPTNWGGVDDLYARVNYRRDDFENVVINGPFNASGPGDTPSRRAIFTCRPTDAASEATCARKILAQLATRAFRRPMAENDPSIDTLMKFYEVGRKRQDFESGIQQGIARLLTDPQFLYRIEKDRTDVADGGVYRITDLELASRLSFFIWSTVPDRELLEIASQNRLSDPKVLEQQTRRMLADARSSELVDNFVGQWLHLRELKNSQPSDRDFDENLRQAFQQETQLLFANIVREDRPVIELLDADYTFVNDRLARHYGIDGVRGSYMRRVSLPKNSPRRGVLGQGSILTVTSVGDRTSPVIRGAWVMETLMGAPVPRPPPGVEADLKAEENAAPTTVRTRLERHRENPSCSACHQIMDPIGFSLENFDLVGRWRDHDGPNPVDTSGQLVDGTPLSSPQALRAALLSRKDSFVTSFTEKLLTYALGRRIEYFDQPAIRDIVRAADRQDDRFSAIVLGIVNSEPFQFKAKAPAGRDPNTKTASR